MENKGENALPRRAGRRPGRRVAPVTVSAPAEPAPGWQQPAATMRSARRGCRRISQEAVGRPRLFPVTLAVVFVVFKVLLRIGLRSQRLHGTHHPPKTLLIGWRLPFVVSTRCRSGRYRHVLGRGRCSAMLVKARHRPPSETVKLPGRLYLVDGQRSWTRAITL